MKFLSVIVVAMLATFCSAAAPMICSVSPESPDNGYVIAVYGCNPGFELHGQYRTVCDETTGRWRGNKPRCFLDPIAYDECGKAGTASRARIAGGTESAPGAWPWQAALYDTNQDELTCSGSLIHKNWVLTAAHCFGEGPGTLTREDMTVYLGMTRRTSNFQRVQEFSVDELIIHPDYYVGDDGGHHNNIALLRLNRKAVLNPYVRTVCLPPSNHNNNRAGWYVNCKRQAVVTGWGSTRLGGHPFFDLMEVTISPVADNVCERAIQGVDTEVEFCAGSRSEGKDACQEDSGGPMVVERRDIYRQIGIVSYGRGCGTTYGVYTRVQHFVDWVNGFIDA